MSFDLITLFASASAMTLGIALASLVLGVIFTLILTAWEMNEYSFISAPATVLVTILRGLPEILVVFLIYFGLNEFINLSNITSGVIALGLIFASYASQTLRGAINAISRGQWEAAATLGLSRSYTFIRIILPQVWRHALPGFANQWLVLLKDTALVSLIGVNDLMRQVEIINATTHKPFTWYSVAMVIYLLITLISQKAIASLERKSNYFERRNAL